MLDKTYVEYVDAIDVAAADAEVNVLLSMADVYEKQARILMECAAEDLPVFEAMFQEAEMQDMIDNANDLRKKSEPGILGKSGEPLIVRLLLIIPRLIKAIVQRISASKKASNSTNKQIEKSVSKQLSSARTMSKQYIRDAATNAPNERIQVKNLMIVRLDKSPSEYFGDTLNRCNDMAAGMRDFIDNALTVVSDFLKKDANEVKASDLTDMIKAVHDGRIKVNFNIEAVIDPLINLLRKHMDEHNISMGANSGHVAVLGDRVKTHAQYDADNVEPIGFDLSTGNSPYILRLPAKYGRNRQKEIANAKGYKMTVAEAVDKIDEFNKMAGKIRAAFDSIYDLLLEKWCGNDPVFKAGLRLRMLEYPERDGLPEKLVRSTIDQLTEFGDLLSKIYAKTGEVTQRMWKIALYETEALNHAMKVSLSAYKNPAVRNQFQTDKTVSVTL